MKVNHEMHSYDVTLLERTPVLTGDYNIKYSTLRASGLIGSLRWWYEWICHACGSSPCTFRNERISCKDDNICRACELFGCTGNSRKFILHVDSEESRCDSIELKYEYQQNKRKIPYPIRDSGKIHLRFLFSGENNKYAGIVSMLLRFIESYGSLGAKTAMGYGVFKILDSDLPEPVIPDWCKTGKRLLYGADIILNTNRINFSDNLGLDKEAKRKEWMISSPAIRYNLRQILHGQQERNLRHGIFGIVGNNSSWSNGKASPSYGSKSSLIKVSHLYKQDGKWHFRIWALIDEEYHISAKSVLEILMDPVKLARSVEKWLNLADGIASATVFPCNMLEAMKKVCNVSSV